MAEAQHEFKKEAKLFEQRRSEWLGGGKVDQWVAIDGDDVLGFWPTLGQALKHVDARFGRKPVFVKQIKLVDKPKVIQRIGG